MGMRGRLALVLLAIGVGCGNQDGNDIARLIYSGPNGEIQDHHLSLQRARLHTTGMAAFMRSQLGIAADTRIGVFREDIAIQVSMPSAGDRS